MSLFSTLIFAGPVNINQADATTLAKELDGVGEKKAAAIVEYRDQYGEFKSIKELAHLNRETIKLLHQYHPVSVSFGFFICLYLRILKFDFIWIYSFLSIFPLFFYLFDTLDTFHFNLMNSFSFIFRALLVA